MDKIFLLLLVVCIWGSCFNAVNSSRKRKYKRVYCRTSADMPGPCIPNFIFPAVNSNVFLSCPLVGARLKFVHPKNDVTNKYIQYGNNLKIMNFHHRDTGNYTCIAYNGSGHQISSYTWIVMFPFFRIPGKKPIKSETELLVGSKMVFNCHSLAKGGVYLLHSKSNDTRNASIFSDTYRLMTDNRQGTFEIKALFTRDSGYYYCGKQTSQGTILALEELGKLIVRGLPRITPKRTTIVKEGDRMRFLCVFSGPENISWYKNGKEIIPPARLHEKKKADKKLLKLIIKNVNETDAGRYQCRVTIGGETAGPFMKFYVFAIRHAAVVPQGRLAPNSSVNVTCATTERSPTIVSFRSFSSTDFKVIKPDNKKYLGVGFNIISIVDLNKKDEGEYKCQAKWKGMNIEKKAGEVRLFK